MKISSFTHTTEKNEFGGAYPWVGIGVNGTVVVFSERHKGTVINKLNGSYSFGAHRTDWKMADFKPFIGEIKIVCAND